MTNPAANVAVVRAFLDFWGLRLVDCDFKGWPVYRAPETFLIRKPLHSLLDRLAWAEVTP